MTDFVLPPTLTDKLVAVNTLLRSIGEAPVDTLSPAQAVDAQTAEASIDEVHLATLTRGWHFNREDALSLDPDGDGNILLPDNCLSVEQNEDSTGHPVVERARQLYDMTDHTFTFTEAQTVDLILFLPFEEVPEYCRRYVTIAAAQLFQGRIQSSRIVQLVQDPYVAQALATLEQREDAARPQNLLYGNKDSVSKLFGRGVRRRS